MYAATEESSRTTTATAPREEAAPAATQGTGYTLLASVLGATTQGTGPAGAAGREPLALLEPFLAEPSPVKALAYWLHGNAAPGAARPPPGP